MYYLYPGDVENLLSDTGPGGYAAQSGADYFPELLRRVKAVGGDRLTELQKIIADAAEVEAYARKQLADGAYTYDEAADKYTLNDSEGLYERFYDVYSRFSEWLTRVQL